MKYPIAFFHLYLLHLQSHSVILNIHRFRQQRALVVGSVVRQAEDQTVLAFLQHRRREKEFVREVVAYDC